MKHILPKAVVCCAFFSLCTGTQSVFAQKIDCDLTWMSSTMVYAEVWNMLTAPENYLGKTIKMRGTYNPIIGNNTGVTYHLLLIDDAAACCQQGLEFKLKDGTYPAPFETIEITGIYSAYKENADTYYYIQSDSWQGVTQP